MAADLLSQLQLAEKSVVLYMNKRKDPRWINRTKKFVHSPFKFLYLNTLKAGIPLKNKVRVRTFWGCPLSIPLSDENAAVIFYTGTLDLPECAVMRYLIKNLKPGDIFYDLGTHFGIYTLLARKIVGSAGQVHSFEPNPQSAGLLRANHIPFNEVAISDARGTAEFFDTSGRKSATSSLLSDAVQKIGVPYKITKVQTITLDEYIESHAAPTIMKIDVEGAENKVLRGAKNLLFSSNPIIIMEVWDEPHITEGIQEALAILKDNGYVSFRILPNGDLKEEKPIPGKIGEYENFCFKKA